MTPVKSIIRDIAYTDPKIWGVVLIAGVVASIASFSLGRPLDQAASHGLIMCISLGVSVRCGFPLSLLAMRFISRWVDKFSYRIERISDQLDQMGVPQLDPPEYKPSLWVRLTALSIHILPISILLVLSAGTTRIIHWQVPGIETGFASFWVFIGFSTLALLCLSTIFVYLKTTEMHIARLEKRLVEYNHHRYQRHPRRQPETVSKSVDRCIQWIANLSNRQGHPLHS